MNLKRIITIIIISFAFTGTTFSQDCYSDKKHEINLGYFNIFDLSNSQNLGIGYKYHFNQSAVRLNANFDFTGEEHENNRQNYFFYYWYDDYYVTDFFEYNLKIGYELHVNINKFQVFYGSDFIFNRSKLNRIYGREYNLETVYDVKMKIEEQGYGISPFIGIKYFLNKRISISSETNLNILFQKTNSKSFFYSDANNQTLEKTDSETSIGLSPLGLITINFHL